MCVASSRPPPSSSTQHNDRQQSSRQPVAPSTINSELEVTKLTNKTPPWLTDKKPDTRAQLQPQTRRASSPSSSETLSKTQDSYDTSATHVPIYRSPVPFQKPSKRHKSPETCSDTSPQSQPEPQSSSLACDDDVEFDAIFGSDVSDDGLAREIKEEHDRDGDREELVSIEAEFQRVTAPPDLTIVKTEKSKR